MWLFLLTTPYLWGKHSRVQSTGHKASSIFVSSDSGLTFEYYSTKTGFMRVIGSVRDGENNCLVRDICNKPHSHLFRCWWAVQVAPYYGGPDLLQLSGGQGNGVPLLQKGEVCSGEFSLLKNGIQRWNHIYVLVTPSLGAFPKEELFSSWRYKYNSMFTQISIVHKQDHVWRRWVKLVDSGKIFWVWLGFFLRFKLY